MARPLRLYKLLPRLSDVIMAPRTTSGHCLIPGTALQLVFELRISRPIFGKTLCLFSFQAPASPTVVPQPRIFQKGPALSPALRQMRIFLKIKFDKSFVLKGRPDISPLNSFGCMHPT